MLKDQGDGTLPFYVDPDSDSLYGWVSELWDWPESQLKRDMQKLGLRSIM